jgi:hypothetical protein
MMVDLDWTAILDRGTALAWFLLALLGIALRMRRLYHLNRIILPKPEQQEDVDYLRSVKRSTYYRLGVKFALLIGSMIALFQIFELFLVWRVAIIIALILMALETTNVDSVRARLARNARTRRASG